MVGRGMGTPDLETSRRSPDKNQGGAFPSGNPLYGSLGKR